MKKKKTLNALILAISLGLPTCGLSAQEVIDGIAYELDAENLTAEVAYSSSVTYSGELVIPETVTSDGVTYSVTSIGDYAVYFCTSLTSVTIPNTVKSIGYGAFYYDQALATINFGTGLETISDYGFYYCSAISSLSLPSGLDSIGSRAFNRCTSLTSVTIPASVTKIGTSAFGSCSALEEFIVEEGSESFASYDGVLYTAGPTTALLCPLAKSGDLTIPEGVTSIGESAFYACTGLTSISLPSTLETIGDGAFESCTGITSIELPASVSSVGDEAFAGCSSLATITVEEGNEAYSAIDNILYEGDGERLICCAPGLSGDITIPSGVTTLGKKGFYGCNSLVSITLPSSVTTIESYAIYSCTGLTSLIVGTGVESIGQYFLWFNYSLEDIYCYGSEPCTPDGEIFSTSYSQYEDITLHVPAGSKDSYAADTYWGKFTTITDDIDEETAGIAMPSVSGEESSDTYYNIMGIRVANPSKGLYIKDGKKVIIK